MKKIMKWLGITEIKNEQKRIREQREIEKEWERTEIEDGFYMS